MLRWAGAQELFVSRLVMFCDSVRRVIQPVTSWQLGTWMEGRLGHAVDTMYTCRIHVEYM